MCTQHGNHYVSIERLPILISPASGGVVMAAITITWSTTSVLRGGQSSVILSLLLHQTDDILLLVCGQHVASGCSSLTVL